MTHSTHIDLKTEVSAILAIRWDDFAVQHPALSRVIDQHQLVEAATSHLRLDPEYQQALAGARAAGASAETLLRLIDRYVVVWLGKLL
jgi:hypothetical protein